MTRRLDTPAPWRDIPPRAMQALQHGEPPPPSPATVARLERQERVRELASEGRHGTEIARLVGCTPWTVYRDCQKLGITLDRGGSRPKAPNAAKPTKPAKQPTRPPRHGWSPAELAILQDAYPRGGAEATRDALIAAGHRPRTPTSISTYAQRHDVHYGDGHAITNPLLTARQRDTLHRLAELDGELLDDQNDPAACRNLRSLQRAGLAKHEGDGLWRITLKGLVQARGQEQAAA